MVNPTSVHWSKPFKHYKFLFSKCQKLSTLFTKIALKVLVLLWSLQVRFASFFFGEFITAIVVNPPERRLAKCTSVHFSGQSCTLVRTLNVEAKIQIFNNIYSRHLLIWLLKISYSGLWYIPLHISLCTSSLNVRCFIRSN